MVALEGTYVRCHLHQGWDATSDIDYTHTNQPALMIFANGNTEIDRQYTYSDSTARLTSVLVDAKTSATTHLANHSYTYSDAGLLTSDSNTADGQSTDTQCDRYDALQELIAAWTPSTNSCTADPASSALGGPAPYWTSYTYNTSTGNRVTVIKHATSLSGSDSRASYTYAAPAGQPHGLSSTTTATAPAGTSPTGAGWTTTGTASYGYNVNGQTTSRSNQSLTWSAEGRLAKVTTGTAVASNIYDPDGNLLLQTDPTAGTTLYLRDTELHIATGSNVVTGVRTYSVDGMPIAERSTTPAAPTTSKLFWLDPSELGQNTADDEVDAVTVAVKHRYLDPFGNARGSAPTWTSNHTFLNAPANATTATVHLGARDYDPALGRFLSADPVLDPKNPQQANGYSYASNSPVTSSDPTGLMVDRSASNLCDQQCEAGVVPVDPTPSGASGSDGGGGGGGGGGGQGSLKNMGKTGGCEEVCQQNQPYHEVCDPNHCELLPATVHQIPGEEALYNDPHEWWCEEMTTCDTVGLNGFVMMWGSLMGARWRAHRRGTSSLTGNRCRAHRRRTGIGSCWTHTYDFRAARG